MGAAVKVTFRSDEPIAARHDGVFFPFDRAAMAFLTLGGTEYFLLPGKNTEAVKVSAQLQDKFDDGGAGPAIVVRTWPLILDSYLEMLMERLWWARKAGWHGKIAAAPRAFTRDDERISLARIPLNDDGPIKEWGESRALLVHYQDESYRIQHFAEDARARTTDAVQELMDDGWKETTGKGPAKAAWPRRPTFRGIVSWPGGDGSRIDAKFDKRIVERLQAVDSSGAVLWRLRTEFIKTYNWVVILEEPAGEVKFRTARTMQNRGGGLTTYWDKKPSKKHAKPDPSPLPV